MSVTQLFTNLGHKKSRRAGRGIAANLGKTAGRGTKGQKARTGSGRKIRVGFEGGQTPLYRQIAKKRGFSHHVVKPVVISTTLINQFYSAGETVSPQTLVDKKIIRRRASAAGVKIVGGQKLKPNVKFDGVKLTRSLQ